MKGKKCRDILTPIRELISQNLDKKGLAVNHFLGHNNVVLMTWDPATMKGVLEKELTSFQREDNTKENYFKSFFWQAGTPRTMNIRQLFTDLF